MHRRNWRDGHSNSGIITLIRVGIGGWTYEPWRGVFYPPGLAQARELAHASRNVTTIEINGTFYGTQKPESFRRWAEETPDDFVFSLKAPRYATNRRVLAEAGSSIERFFASGLSELKSKLGPILWQMPPTKKFDAEDFAAFLALLPRKAGGKPVRHAIEVRHETFLVPAFVELARRFSVAIVFADSDKYPAIADVTADFIYARLQATAEEIPTGYAPSALDKWAARARAWADGGEPADLARLAAAPPAREKRDVFFYMISGAKVRAPAAAMALLERLN
jgi:uncharacterized protein YecE (DUF72 family)